MSSAAERVQSIIGEIESDDFASRTAQEIADILLGQDMSSAMQSQGGENPLLETIDRPIFENRLSAANATCQIRYYRPIYSCRRVIGRFIVFFKKVFRKVAKFLIEPIVNDQNRFNSAATQTLNSIRNNDTVFEAQIGALYQMLLEHAQRIDSNEELVEECVEKLDLLIAQLREFADVFQTQQSEIGQLHEQVKSYQDELSGYQNAFSSQQRKMELMREQCSKRSQVYEAIDYHAFENQFRGSRESIKDRQKMYVPYFKDCSRVLDLGPGRGEFLELLREHQISATGVEIYGPFVEYCRMRGQEIIQEDAVEYLKRQDTASCDGIFSAQLVEHIPFEQLVSLCRECYRILEPGRTLIIETPNPTCLSTFINSFYIDPSHLKPVHPQTLEYLLKEAGFSSVQILYTEQSKTGYRLPLLDGSGANVEKINDGINYLSDIMFGSQDYAVIAVK